MTKMYRDVFLFLSGFIAVVIGQDKGNTALLTPSERVKQIVRTIHVTCSDCSYSYEQVFLKTSYNAICGAYFRFKSCVVGKCPGDYIANNFIIEADAKCDDSIANIKDIVRKANARCGYCDKEHATVLQQTNTDNTCSAFLRYKVCIRTNCSSVSLWDNVVDAVSICASPEDRMTQLAYPYCDQCSDLRSDVLRTQNISSLCNAFFHYKSCVTENCNNVSTSIDITEANLICVETLKPIKEIARDINAKCDYCSRKFDSVESTSYTDLCESFLTYKDCILDHCYYFYKTTDFTPAESICVQSKHTRGPSTLEERIKQIVGELDGRCSRCPVQYDVVMSGNKKAELCSAFISYKGCFLNKCYVYSSSYNIEEADSLCITFQTDGCGGDRVSLLILLLAAVMSLALS